MTLIQQLLDSPLAHSIGWALLHLVWQGSIVALVLAAALRMMRRQSAGLRYVVSCAALLVMVLLPVLTVARSYGVGSTEWPVSTPPVFSALGTLPHLEIDAAAAPASSWMERLETGLSSFLPILMLLWSLGVVFLMARLIHGFMQMKRLTSMTEMASVEWERAVRRLSAVLGLDRQVRIFESRLVDVPTVIGWIRPVILLPVSALAGLSPEQLETIVAHELAHIRRYDFLVNFLQTIVETFFFYHPATWWISKQIRIERENCCDDAAVAVCGNPLVYARALADLEHLRVASVPAVSANGASLMERVRRLVSGPDTRCSSRWLAGVSVMALAGVFFVATPLTIFAFRNSGTLGTAAGNDLTVTASRLSDADNQELILGVPALHASLALSSDLAGMMIFFDEEAEAGRFSGGNNDLEADRDESEVDQEDTADSVLGRDELTIEDLVALKQHHITPELLDELRKLGQIDLTVKEAIAVSVHGVTPEFVRGMKEAGYPELDIEDLVAMRVHGIKPEFVKALRQAGLAEIDTDTLTALAIHGVSPQFVKEMREAGLATDDVDELVTMRVHGINPQLVAELKSLGMKDLSTDDIVGMAVHGVTPAFVREMAAAGYGDLSLEDLQVFRIHGVSADYVAQMKNTGLKFSSEELVEFRIHGITPEFVRSLREAGLTELTHDEIVTMKIHGLSPEDMKAFRRK